MNQDLQDQIKAFLRGELSEQERKTFLQRMETDDQFAERVGLQEQIFQTRSLTRRLFLPISIAAGIILIGIVWIVSSQPSPSTLPAWAEAFAIPDPGINGSLKEKAPDFTQAMVSYKEAKYTKALDQFRHLPLGVVGMDTVVYYVAQCHFGLGEWEACQKALTQVAPSSRSLWNKVDWYYALSTLGIEEKKGIELLRLMQAEEGHLFQKQAAELLEASP